MRSLGTPLSATSIHAEWLTFAGTGPLTASRFVAFAPKTIPHLPPLIIRKCNRFKVRIAPAAESTGEHRDAASAIRTIQLTAMFGAWYSLNIYFNIFNKQILKVFPFPANVTAFQFGCGTVMVLAMWGLNLHPLPKLSRTKFLSLVPLVIAHTFGNLLTNISLGNVSVSFTHTIKAMEPFFTVLFASIFLGDRPNIWVVSSLFPIVCGVALASFTEASFNWVGFTAAMASNVTNQSRNVMSKKLMNLKEEPLDNINMFSILTVSSFFLLVPAAILLEGAKFTPHYLSTAAAQGTNTKQMLIRCLLSGLCFHCYQQVSYMILQMINAVTHAVGNSVKRVVVIVSSVLFFKTPVSFVNSLGTAMALAGVFMYSQAKRMKPKLR